MIFFFLYELLLHLIALPVAVKMGVEMMRTGKYRTNFLPRVGKGFPKIKKGNKRVIWVHAVSFGETKAVAPLVRQLKDEDTIIVLSTVTESGHREGKRAVPEADHHVYLPFDLSYIVRPIVRSMKPDLVILTETDFWFNFQDEAKRCGAELILINGKLSEKSLVRYERFPLFAKKLIYPYDLLLLQGDLYANRFRKIGVSPQKLKVTGNIKLDGFDEGEGLLTREMLKVGEDPILTLGSTHDPEEKLWIAALNRIWLRFPDLKVIIVPRHPERFDTVAKMLTDENIPFNRFSKRPNFDEKKVLLVDAMGVLRQCYKLSTIAFVGGSLTKKVGGHNILEPAYFGVPVLYGPHMYGQPDLCDLMERYQAGVCLQHDLVKQTESLLGDKEKREQIGQRGTRMVEESRGSLEETLRQIRMHVKFCPLSRDGAVVSSLGS